MESEWRAKHAGGRGWLLWLVGSRKAFGEEEALHLGLQVGGAHKAVEGGRGYSRQRGSSNSMAAWRAVGCQLSDGEY